MYSIILPVYNERENLPLILSMLVSTFETEKLSLEVIVVEDNSPDGTRDVAYQLQKIFGENVIKILAREGKLGLGSAYKDGLKLCKGEYVILMDADMSHHPKHIPEFIQKQKERDYDVVTGTRYARGGGVSADDCCIVIDSLMLVFLLGGWMGFYEGFDKPRSQYSCHTSSESRTFRLNGKFPIVQAQCD